MIVQKSCRATATLQWDWFLLNGNSKWQEGVDFVAAQTRAHVKEIERLERVDQRN